jgi:hypothetical protein
MATGPGDELAASAAGRGRLRASHADREQVIGTLKAAFVQGMLAKDEFDLRVGQAFASRTYAELAAVTAGIPAQPAPAQPAPAQPAPAQPAPAQPAPAQPPGPARTQGGIMRRPGRMMAVATAAYAGVWAFTFLLPWPRNSEGEPPHSLGILFFPSTILYPLVLLICVINMAELWREKRSGGRPPCPPSAGPDAQVPPGDHGHRRPYGPRPGQVPG